MAEFICTDPICVTYVCWPFGKVTYMGCQHIWMLCIDVSEMQTWSVAPLSTTQRVFWLIKIDAMIQYLLAVICEATSLHVLVVIVATSLGIPFEFKCGKPEESLLFCIMSII